VCVLALLAAVGVSQVNQKTYKCKRSDFKIMTRRMPPTDLVGADVLVKTVEGFEKPWVPGKVVGVTTQDRCVRQGQRTRRRRCSCLLSLLFWGLLPMQRPCREGRVAFCVCAVVVFWGSASSACPGASVKLDPPMNVSSSSTPLPRLRCTRQHLWCFCVACVFACVRVCACVCVCSDCLCVSCAADRYRVQIGSQNILRRRSQFKVVGEDDGDVDDCASPSGAPLRCVPVCVASLACSRVPLRVLLSVRCQ
jgi:hypothetical protein